MLVSAHILTTGVLWISAVDNASTGYESPQVSCFWPVLFNTIKSIVSQDLPTLFVHL